MPVDVKTRKSRPVASKQQFRDEIISLRKVGSRMLHLLDLVTTDGITRTDHDKACFDDLRRRWDSIKRSEGM